MQSRLRHSIVLREPFRTALSGSAFDWAAYWAEHLFGEDDLLLDYSARSGNALVDAIGAENATILSPEFCNISTTAAWRGNKTRSTEKLFDGNSYTIYYKVKQISDASYTGTSDYLPILGGGTLATQRGAMVVIDTGGVRVYFCDGTTRYRPFVVPTNSVNTVLKPLEWFEIFIQIDFPNKLFKVNIYDYSGNDVGTPISQDISAFVFNNNDNNTYFEFKNKYFVLTNFKKYTGLKTLEQCQTDSYVTDIQLHYATIESGSDLSANEHHLNGVSYNVTNKVYTPITTWCLDHGFMHNRSSNYPDPDYRDFFVPYKVNGDQTLRFIFSIYNECSGDLTAINMLDCKIRFQNAFFDRSNATIWGAACRASAWYDAANTKDWHITELNQRTLYEWANTGYKGRLYVKGESFNYLGTYKGSIEDRERVNINRILLYSTDHAGLENRNILAFTGDIFAAVSTSVFDVNGYIDLGYLQATKPMYIQRIDDGYDNCYTGWFPFFTALGVIANSNIHGGLVGTAGFMTWDQIKALIAAGWEVGGTNYLDNDYDVMTFVDSKADIILNVNAIEAEGITCHSLIPNKLGSSAHHSHYLGWMMGHRCIISSAGYYGSANGANPVILDKYNMGSMAYDTGTYTLDKLNNAAEIALVKAQLDLCVAENRIAVGFTHAYTVAHLPAAITEIINYAISIGISIVTFDEALDNCKYL